MRPDHYYHYLHHYIDRPDVMLLLETTTCFLVILLCNCLLANFAHGVICRREERASFSFPVRDKDVSWQNRKKNDNYNAANESIRSTGGDQNGDAYYFREKDMEGTYNAAMQTVLGRWWGFLFGMAGLSPELRRCLLLGPTEHDDDDNRVGNNRMVYKHRNEDKDTMVFIGLPRRPLYRELVRRLLYVTKNTTSNNNKDDGTDGYYCDRCHLPAQHFGMIECTPIPLIPPIAITHHHNDDSWNKWFGIMQACHAWLQSAGEDGIRELLGMRKTVGSTTSSSSGFLLLPTRKALYKAAQEPTKPNAKPPLLSVCARARAKHAHRGTIDCFFGRIKGGNLIQNADAEVIVKKLLNEAAWINCHEFGGSDGMVLEVRVAAGYGARWSVPLFDSDKKLKFRGFLEPQMQNGHEKRWRH
mmetsp:Transcript_37128/g.54603  ORF Transcript_37128/g.54603 Transcript_37128/m.54603 type:complete len:414 (+) Transcript_37128:29-1270(+)